MDTESMEVENFSDGVTLPFDGRVFDGPIDAEASHEAVELLVVGLDPTSSQTPAQQVEEIFLQSRIEGAGFYVPIHVTTVAKSSNWVSDYVRVRGGKIAELEATKKFLIERGLETTWSPGTGKDKTRTVSASLKHLWNSAADDSKLEDEFLKAFKTLVPDIAILSFFVSTFGQEPKAYIDINKRSAIPTLTANKVTVGKTNVTIFPPMVIIPVHPFQLAVYGQYLPTQSRLDAYTRKHYGLRHSEVINENVYTFVVAGDWDHALAAQTTWDPTTDGMAMLPKPQLLFHYNTQKRTRKTADEVKNLGSSLGQQFAAHDAEVKNAVSKVATVIDVFKKDQQEWVAKLMREQEERENVRDARRRKEELDYRRESEERHNRTLTMITSGFRDALADMHTENQRSIMVLNERSLEQQRKSSQSINLSLQLAKHNQTLAWLMSEEPRLQSCGQAEQQDFLRQVETEKASINRIHQQLEGVAEITVT
jgi:hypothetical protein